jgi:alpha-galactosidase
MSTPIRISVIGAGSAQFSLGLVKDICLTESLNGSQISFMDIDGDRLEMIHRLASRYANELGADLGFDLTESMADSMQDADFVINTASAHTHAMQRLIRETVESYGYYHGGGLGGGNYHNLQLMLDVVGTMERICPDAWLIQSGNPVYQGCTLMTRESDIKVCGLCHGHYGVHQIANTLGFDLDELTWQAPGLNHNIWLTHFLYRGEDAYPVLEDWIANEAEEYWRSHEAERTHDIQMSRGTIHQYRMFGLMPIGDTPRAVGWWYHTSLPVKKHWFGEPYGGPDTHIARPQHVQKLEDRLAHMETVADDPKASLIEAFGDTKTHEQQVPIIDGLVNNNEGYFQVNVPNHGALPGVPDDVVVEVPALVNAKGIQPVRVQPLPEKIMYEQILPGWLQMERELLAFRDGDRRALLFDALESNQTREYDQALSAVEEILMLKGHEQMNEHYTYGAGDSLLRARVNGAAVNGSRAA